MRKKLLISAYAISPVKGSEYGAAWNTVTNLATRHDLWVLYGMSDDHMGDTQTLRQYISKNPVPGVSFIEVRPGRLAKAINLLNKAGLGWFFYFAYYLWQKEAYKAALKLINTVDIDAIHQLGPIGYREPGFLWQLDKPMVWGPVGGMNKVDKRLIAHKPLLTQVKFRVKNTINHLQLTYGSRIKKAFGNADVLIAATIAGQRTIMNRFGRESHYLSEQGTIGNTSLNEAKFNTKDSLVQLVWCGTHIDRKNLQMGIDALALVKQQNWVLNVLGSGPLTHKLKKKAAKLGLAGKIVWHGQLNRTEAIKIIADAHLHIITSIAEDNPAVIFEAMSCGVPTLTIDHCGMGDVICSKCGIKIPVNEYPAMVAAMAGVLNHLLINPQLLKELAYTTLSYSAGFQWDKRLAELNRIYDEAISIHEKRSDYFMSDQNLIAW